ncbi:hypothetical protein [Novosphingobium sp. AP12]|uniref:hypothetical protein n=1 Tax=Novosphingobium sp. AP12 TaxID=1144305 RepID=UPI000271E217|nr:hypothetical protein [Novosphingobium sp. AP12]EJL33396.1 hypothetical protein PMI02_01145 [Novosphingobium sp. AP12]
MKHLFSAFPAGSAGAALLLFRCSLALSLATQALPKFVNDVWPAIILGILVVAIALGLYLRISAILSMGVIALMMGSLADQSAAHLAHALDAVALALIGPGAFSIDARLFGRSTINLPR